MNNRIYARLPHKRSHVEELWRLHGAAYSSFQRRASHEFRFGLAMWTAGAALIGLMLKHRIEFASPTLAIGAAITGVALHFWYELGMERSNNTDLAKCYQIEDDICRLLRHTWRPDVQHRIDWQRGMRPVDQIYPFGVFWNPVLRPLQKKWSHICHVGLTAVLMTIAVILSFLHKGASYTMPS